jgi:LTXXQ motif family protein
VPNRKFTLAAALLATALGGAGAITLPVQDAAAQQAATPPASSTTPAQPQRPMRPMRPSHIEGRLAFLKTELHITPAQEPQWNKVAQVMRQDSTERRQAFEQMRNDRSAQPNALRWLETRTRMSQMRAQQSERFLAAFRPLYDSMSDAQKQAANDLLAPHGHRFGHHRG